MQWRFQTAVINLMHQMISRLLVLLIWRIICNARVSEFNLNLNAKLCVPFAPFSFYKFLWFTNNPHNIYGVLYHILGKSGIKLFTEEQHIMTETRHPQMCFQSFQLTTILKNLAYQRGLDLKICFLFSQ